MGWNYHDEFEDIFLLGATNYNPAVEGGSNHVHSFSTETGPPNSTNICSVSMMVVTTSSDHVHDFSGLSSEIGLPSYITVPFFERIDHTYGGLLNLSIGEERLIRQNK